jgi:predicted nucleic acid-binding protein
MRGRSFVDTNICIYAFANEGLKTDLAKTVIVSGITISTQVLNEYVNVSRRKLLSSWEQIRTDLDLLMEFAIAISPVDVSTHLKAREIAERHNLQFFDSLLMASALEAGCTRLISEDMQDGMIIDGLLIENPFKPTTT